MLVSVSTKASAEPSSRLNRCSQSMARRGLRTLEAGWPRGMSLQSALFSILSFLTVLSSLCGPELSQADEAILHIVTNVSGSTTSVAGAVVKSVQSGLISALNVDESFDSLS